MNLSGYIPTSLVLQCEKITYHNCKILGPFIVGASMADEDSWRILSQRAMFNVTEDMLKDPPRIGDPRYPMTSTHGPTWEAWQDVWLFGLRGLHDRDVYVFCGGEEFKRQFERDSTDAENSKKSFDPAYQLPEGGRARNVLDWQRMHLEIVAMTNNLCIQFISPGSNSRIAKPGWYC